MKFLNSNLKVPFLRFLPVFLVFFGVSGCGDVNLKFQDYAAQNTPESVLYLPIHTGESRLKISSRHHLVSHLEEIFGALTTVQKNLILTQASIVGGPEDFYESLNIDRAGAAVLPVSISARESLRIRVCNSLAQSDAQVATAIGRIFEVTGVQLNALKVRRPESNIELLSVYNAFFPGKPPSNRIMESLQKLSLEADLKSPQAAEVNDAWKMLFLVLCLDPSWQLL